MAKITNVWIYKNEKGEIYAVRAVIGNDVVEYPVSSSSEKTVKKQ